MTQTLPRRIEVEDLLPGDVFEYELDEIEYELYEIEYGYQPKFHRVGWKTTVKRDQVRGDRRYHGKITPPMQIREAVIADKMTSPNFLSGGWETPEDAAKMEHVHLVPFEEFGEKDWWAAGHEGEVWVEPGQLFENAVLLSTAQGQNNHGYVWRKPKDVVVLTEREAEEPPPK